MEKFDNVKQFLNYLKNNAPPKTAVFAEACLNDKLYKLIPIVEGEYPLPNDLYCELFDIMSDNLDKPYVVMALSQSETVPFAIQNLIVNALLHNNIKELDTTSYYKIISNILKNFRLSPLMIRNLFEHDFNACTRELYQYTPTKEKPSPYPHTTSDTICELYIDKLSAMSSIDLESLNATMPFACVFDSKTISYILDNMPQHIGATETIVSYLINSVTLADEQKNKLFDQYGYNTSEYLINLTPYISNALYQSAIQTLENADEDKERTIYGSASHFLRKAIIGKALTESAQIDFINRIFLEKRMSDYNKYNFLSLLAEYTDSSKVLHIMLTNTVSENLRSTIIRNKHISKEDLQEYADIVFKKIVPTHVPDKWLYEIEHLSKQIVFTDTQYEILINAKAYESLIKSSTTPDKYIKQVIAKLKENIKDEPSVLDITMLNEAVLHSELLAKNCCSQKQLDFATKYFFHAENCYKENKPINLYRLSLNTDISVFNDKDFCDKLYKCIKYSTRKVNWKPNYGNRKDFLLNIKDHLRNNEDSEYKQLDYYQLLFKIEENARAFCIETDTYNNGLLNLKEYAEEHCKLTKEMLKKTKCKEVLDEPQR